MRSLVDMIWELITEPRTVAEKVVNLRLGEGVVFQAAVFVAICSTILTYLLMQIIANHVIGEVDESTVLLNEVLAYVSSIQPIYFTLNQVFQMLVFSIIITLGGKLFNGNGKFFEALLCVTVIEALLIVLKVLQLIFIPFSALLAFLIIIPGVIWSLWAFASMAASIHGFKSTLLTFFGGFALSVLFLVSLNFFY